jgi:hypothetical protein
MPNNDNSFSRRQIVGSAGFGLAAIAGTVQASAEGSTAAAAPKPLEDPTKKYPRPPYNRQSQPWPGLASKMDPAPDHGEKSYRGSGRLTGRKALITGGDSGMGRAAAIAFAREGADLAINYLPAEEPDASEVVELIQAAGRKAIPIPGDLRDASFCRRLVEDAVHLLGGLDILVSNAGRQQSRTSIAEVSDEDFDATMKTNIYAPFYIIKAALPHLQPGSAIIATASEQAYDPSPDLYDYAQTKADHELRQVASEAVGSKGHKSERRRAWANLDPAADFGRRVGGKGHHLWRDSPAGPSRPTGGVGRHLRPLSRRRRQLHHGQHLWRWRRSRPALASTPHAD